MDASAVVVGVVTAVLVAAVVVILARQGHPSGSTDPRADEPAGPSEADRLYHGVDRPAGPDAENDPFDTEPSPSTTDDPTDQKRR